MPEPAPKVWMMLVDALLVVLVVAIRKGQPKKVRKVWESAGRRLT